MAKQEREKRYDSYGVVTLMAEADGYVMVRRPGAMPFVQWAKDWRELPTKPSKAAKP